MLFSKETLRSYAQSKGIVNIDDDALRILGQDLEYRLKEVAQEAAKFMLASRRTKLTVSDVNYALISRNVEPLFGYDPQESLVFRGLPCNIYYVPDEDIDLEEFLERPIPKIPLKPCIQSHWLAIEGVQPPIQQNPLLLECPAIKMDPLAIYQEELEYKQHYKHLLTKELCMYFDKILQTMETDCEMASSCLRNETGIQQLVPYFLHHFKSELRKKCSNAEQGCVVLQMYDSLLNNKYIFIDPYLHEILPPLLSCVVSNSNIYEVKHKASDIVKEIYDVFGKKYLSMAPRIVNFLIKTWLDETKTEHSHYGAVYCLINLSNDVVKGRIIENIPKYKSHYLNVMKLLSTISSNI